MTNYQPPPLTPLLEKCRLTKFLCFKTTICPRLVRMFNANLVVIGGKLSKVAMYVMHKHTINDFQIFA